MDTPQSEQRATLTVDGMTVVVEIEHTEDGPRVVLQGENCHLEGEMPGEYFLRPVDVPTVA